MPEIEEQRVTASAELAGLRLDQALAKIFPEYSRSRLKEWVLGGLVTVDGRQTRPRDRLAGGETIVLRPEPEPDVTVRPEAIPLRIIYEWPHMLNFIKTALSVDTLYTSAGELPMRWCVVMACDEV